MHRGDVLPTKGFIYKALGLTNLLPTEGGENNGTQGSITTIGVSGGTLPKETLVKA